MNGKYNFRNATGVATSGTVWRDVESANIKTQQKRKRLFEQFI